MKSSGFFICLLVLSSIQTYAVTFDIVCRPVNSPLEHISLNNDKTSQSIPWALFNKVMPDKALKRFYSITPFGTHVYSNLGFNNSERWNGLFDETVDDCFFYKKMSAELKSDDRCGANLFKEKTENEAELTLFKNYCQSKMPSSVSEMFKPNHDLPGEFINLWDKSFLIKNYNTSNISVLEKKNGDVDSFFQLNIEAEKVWKEILSCENNDAEGARAALAEGRFSCVESADIKNNLNGLIVNIVNYFSSENAVHTPFYDYFNGKYIPGTISHDSAVITGMNELGGVEKYLKLWEQDNNSKNSFELNGTHIQRKRLSSIHFKEKFDQSLSKLKNQNPDFSIRSVLANRVQIHPLFSELVLEILASQFSSYDLVKDFSENNRSRFVKYHFDVSGDPKEIANLNNNIADFSLIFLERMCEPVGLWPSAGFSAMLYMQRKISLSIPLADVDRGWGSGSFPFPEISLDFRRIGYWSADFEKAQLNCVRGKILPDIYYKGRKDIVKYYRGMFRRHTSGN